MSVSPEDVHYIADLARLRFSEEEEEEMAHQLSRVLDYMEKLDELDTDDVTPMSHVLDIKNVFRADEPDQRISREEALQNAPDADPAYFRVPKVIE